MISGKSRIKVLKYGSMQKIDVDVEIHASSFHFQDDDEEKLHVPSTPNKEEENDVRSCL
jgi:hypothetical protein